MSSRRLARTIVSGLGVVLGVGAVLLLGGNASAHGDERHIEIEKYMYMPMATTIEQGTTVTWTNHDAVAHDVLVTSGPVSFRSPMLAQGESWSHAFTVPGPYSYVCSVHPDMKATITVSQASAVADPKPATTPKTSAARPTARAAARVATVTKARTAAHTTAPTAPTAASRLVSAPQSTATLQPLILVVGASAAVVVFCLLLMASRPLVVDGREPKHLDE